MRNVLFDGRVAEALTDWIMENGREIEDSHTPCYCEMKICADDGNTYKFRLYARCEQQK